MPCGEGDNLQKTCLHSILLTWTVPGGCNLSLDTWGVDISAGLYCHPPDGIPLLFEFEYIAGKSSFSFCLIFLLRNLLKFILHLSKLCLLQFLLLSLTEAV